MHLSENSNLSQKSIDNAGTLMLVDWVVAENINIHLVEGHWELRGEGAPKSQKFKIQA